MELVEWLLAVLDEDERVARAAIPRGGTGTWDWNCDHTEPYPFSHDLCAKLECDEITLYDEGGHNVNQTQHIALHDPAAVLADIAAKRAIIARVAEDAAIASDPLRSQNASGMEWHLVQMARDTLRILASAYAHRDGFDPTWA